MNNKFIRTLVIVNGILFPLFFVFLLYKSFFESSDNYGYGYQAESIIVGEELEKAKIDSLVLQGISYETPPKEIYNSTNMYLPISVLTYEEARQLRDDASRAGDFNPAWFNYFNVLFLDKDYNVIGQLLDRKGSVAEITINERYNYDGEKNTVDESVKNIAYRIGFDDSNKDGKLDYNDDHDLYISDLNGQNLTQVTSNKDIVDFEFIRSNSQIFIRFKDRNGLKDEYNYIKFGIYDIATASFNELKDIEKKLIDIEARLMK